MKNLSTYTHITYELGKAALGLGDELNLQDIAKFKFSDKIDKAIADKIINYVTTHHESLAEEAILSGSASRKNPLHPRYRAKNLAFPARK